MVRKAHNLEQLCHLRESLRTRDLNYGVGSEGRFGPARSGHALFASPLLLERFSSFVLISSLLQRPRPASPLSCYAFLAAKEGGPATGRQRHIRTSGYEWSTCPNIVLHCLCAQVLVKHTRGVACNAGKAERLRYAVRLWYNGEQL